MKNFLILIFTTLTFVNAFSQTSPDTTEKLIHIQLLSSNEAYYLVHKNTNVNNDSSTISSLRSRLVLKFTSDGGKTFVNRNIDSVVSKLTGTLNSPSLNIHFVNKNLGFIYGYSTVYAFYPILFRTEDGGNTWQTIFAGSIGTPFRRSDFFMFNETKGIIVNNWSNEPNFNYMLTNDGGKTWKQHTFKISQKNIRIMNADGMLSEVYSEDGNVTIIFTTPDKGNRGSAKNLIIHSTNYGKTFRELK